MAGGNYTWRPLGKNRKIAYDFIQANPHCTKRSISEGTGLSLEAVKNALERGKKGGEIVLHPAKCLRDYTYTIGTLIDRTPRGPNWEQRERAKLNPMPQRGRKGSRKAEPMPKVAKPKPEPKPKKPKVVKPKKVKAQTIKQTKEWAPPELKQVTVTWPEHVKVQVYVPKFQYEPLNISKHVIGRHV